MTESTLVQKSPARKRRAHAAAPRPISPGQDTFADAQALTFEWAAGDGSDFVLEIARDAAFQDVVARVPTGSSTSVTVYDLFRPDGRRYFWRVAAGEGNAGEARSFVAASYQQASAGAVANAAAPATPSAPAAAARDMAVPIDPPYRTGTTAPATVLAVALLMIVSFFVTVGILYTITLGM